MRLGFSRARYACTARVSVLVIISRRFWDQKHEHKHDEIRGYGSRTDARPKDQKKTCENWIEGHGFWLVFH